MYKNSHDSKLSETTIKKDVKWTRNLLFLFLLFGLDVRFTVAFAIDEYYWEVLGHSQFFLSPGEVCDFGLSQISDPSYYLDEMLFGGGDVGCIYRYDPDKSGLYTIGYASAYRYAIESPDDDEPNTCTVVGNPIDPTTGNKSQLEALIQLAGAHPVNFDILYNSNRPEKWRHNYSQSVVSLSNAQVPIYTFSQRSFCPSSSQIIESPSGFGDSTIEVVPDSSNVRFWSSQVKAPIPQITRETAQRACEINWLTSTVIKKFHYSWIEGSTAEYIGNGKCSIKDSDNIERMKLGIYRRPLGGKVSYDLIACDAADPTISPQLDSPDPINVRFTRYDGRLVRYIYNVATGELDNQSYTGEKAEFIVSGVDIIGYLFYNTDDEVEQYDIKGRLLSITALDGHVQTLSYVPDATTGVILLSRVENETGEYIQFGYETVGEEYPFNRISDVTDHSSRRWGFRYDVNDNLEYVDLPDSTSRQYHYEDTGNSDYLTGITDERSKRYASWTYNINLKANSSAHGPAKDIDKVGIVYNESNNQHVVSKVRHSQVDNTTVNIDSIYHTHASGGSKVVAAITGNNDVEFEHNPVTGNLEYKIEHGIKTEYSDYTSSGDPRTILESVGTSVQRQKRYTFDSRFHSKVATITEASVYPGKDKVITNLYDDFGNNTSVTIDGFNVDGIAVSRASNFEYNGPFHQLTLIDGPRTDVSDIYTIYYYADDELEGDNRARMKIVTAPLGIMLYNNITYTPTGKIKSYIDSNNVQSTLFYYYGTDRLQSLLQVDPDTTSAQLTEWTYLATGEVKTINTGMDTEKTSITINYDDARRLTGIVDGLNNTIEYILDSEGNVEQENIRDDSGNLKKQITQTFDSYDRLQLRIQMNEQFTETWSPNGTLDKTIDGKNVSTDYSYDNLKRLTQINQDMGGTSPQTANALTILNYDVQDNLTYVKNPVNGETKYTYDDLGNQLTRDSDDTGLTTYSHDATGNITSMLDANGETINYNYDALNRLITTTTSNVADDYLYQYDNCQNGAGRLCKVSNNNSAQFYQYDAFGNVASQQALQYTYDTANRLETISYPSGAIVRYDYDAAGQVLQVTLERNGSSILLASNINYEAFGDITNLLYGNARTLSQSRDNAYRPLTQSILSVFELNYTQYDANGNLEQRDDTVSNTTALFSYDAHNRLNTATGDFGVRGYEYDKNANRTKLTEDTVSTSSSYDPASNRLSMRGVDNANLDSNGNMLSLGGRGYSYTKHNRLFEVFDNGVLKATYQYNGLGQRISKTLPDGSGKYFIYDTDGKLMAETDINGNILFEYIYLNGQLLTKYTPDSDSDGVSNYEESVAGTNPTALDGDDDGLTDIDELFIYGTQVNDTDSDNDGISDGDEVALGSNPLNGNISVGDINQDGQFNLGDYVLLSQYVLNIRVPTPTEQAQADINQDGVLNIQDMLLMQRTLLGLQLSWSDFSAENIERIFAQLYQGIIPPAYAANGDGAIYYVHNDHLGTPVKMTNEIGLVIWQATYDPFGKATVNEDVDGDGKVVEMNVRFSGQYYDAESELHYNYFRTYDPSLGRYITSDPIGLYGGVNTFGYVGGNPVTRIDATGLCGFGCAASAAFTIYAAYKIYEFFTEYGSASERQEERNQKLIDMVNGDRSVNPDNLQTERMNDVIDTFENATEVESAIDNIGKIGDIRDAVKAIKQCE